MSHHGDQKAIEQRASSKWDAQPALQADFVTKASYVAYCKAEDRGAVKILAPGSAIPQRSPQS